MIMLSQFLGSWWEIDIWVLFTLSLKIVAVVVAVFLFSRVFSRLMRAIRERRRMERRVARQITTFVKYVAYGLGFLMVLAIIGVDIRYIATSLGVIGVAVGFAAKDIIANLLSGIFLIFEKAYQVNDVVKFDDVYGIVRLIKLRSTQIKTFDGNIVTIPNSKIASSTLINLTSGADKMLTSISVKLGYKEDFQRAKQLMKTAASKIEDSHINGDDVSFKVSNIGRRYQD